MKNIAIIPARGGSKRIPRKNIKPFMGKPIIAYSIEAALQSGLVEELEGKIILDSPYNVKEAFDGIEEFSHLWILWQFSESPRSRTSR